MKALILKDWLMLKKSGKMFLVFTLFFAVIGAFNGEENMFFFFFSSIYLTLVPITLLGLEEQVKWDSCAFLLPVSRIKLVLEKYFLVFAGLGVGIGVNLAMYAALGRDISGLIRSIPLVLIPAFLFAAVEFPLIYKMGVAKSRAGYLVLMACVMACLTMAGKLMGEGSEAWNVVITPGILWGGAVAALWLLLVSMAISVIICEKKEL